MIALAAAALLSLGAAAQGKELSVAADKYVWTIRSLARIQHQREQERRREFERQRMRLDPAREATLWLLNARGGRPGSEEDINHLVSREFWDSPYPNKKLAMVVGVKGLIKEILTVYRGERGEMGRSVRRLIISAHGTPGEIGQVLRMEDLLDSEKWRGLDEAFAPGAAIFLQSCSVGIGDKGASFMELLGKRLLSKNGGWVVASLGDYVWDYGRGSGSEKAYRRCRVYPGGRVEFDEPKELASGLDR